MKLAASDAVKEVTPLVTVAIPTWNGAGKINGTLEALALQDADTKCYEVVIVDNDSPETGRVSDDHPGVATLRQKGIECRVVSESRKGAGHARIRGVLEARSKLVCFLDDDNEPEADYITKGVSALTDSSIGVLISRVSPKYETDPPPSVARREHLLAVNRKLGDSVIDWGALPTLAPTITAGMWVRRDVFLSSIPWQTPELLLPDRRGKHLMCGGDIEIGFLIGRAGYRRVYCPDLKVWHLIPTTRLASLYICRLIFGIIRSELTVGARYAGEEYGLRKRASSIARLAFAVLASPFLLLRKDGPRDLFFLLASRCAQIAGPYRSSFINGS